MRSFIVLGMLVLALAGCSKKNPYIGEWESEVSAQGIKVPVVHKFSEDGAYELAGELLGAKVKVTGDYQWSGDKLTVNGKSVSVDTTKSQLPKAIVDQGTTEVAKQLNKPQTGTVSWPDKDTFIVTPDEPANPILTFRRKVAGK
jgi:hypothetical protein